MSTAQLIAILIAIVGGDGVWRLLEHRLSRKDHLTDRKHLSMEEMEQSLEKCAKACLRLLAFNLYSWQESVMAREEKNVGINEWKVMDGQYESYRDFDGNGTVKSRQAWIERNFEQVPDVDVENPNIASIQTVERREVI